VRSSDCWAKIPVVDLPSQEKNQYWAVYWWGNDALYTKDKEGSDQEISDLLEEGRILAGIKVREWKQPQPV